MLKILSMKSFLTIGFLFLASIAFSQGVQISGQVLDAEFDNEPLAFAEVKVAGLELAAITDENGNYELELVPGTYSLEIGFIGYETRLISAEIVRDEDIRLDPVVLESKKFEGTPGLVTENSLVSREE